MGENVIFGHDISSLVLSQNTYKCFRTVATYYVSIVLKL